MILLLLWVDHILATFQDSLYLSLAQDNITKAQSSSYMDHCRTLVCSHLVMRHWISYLSAFTIDIELHLIGVVRALCLIPCRSALDLHSNADSPFWIIWMDRRTSCCIIQLALNQFGTCARLARAWRAREPCVLMIFLILKWFLMDLRLNFSSLLVFSWFEVVIFECQF